MLERLFRFLGWTNGQKESFSLWLGALRRLFGGKVPARRFLAGLLAATELFCAAAFKTPVHPAGEPLDLDGYALVLFDDFNADTLDTNVWYHRGVGPRRLGFNAESQVRLHNGNLILTGEYLDADKGAFGAGWYTGAIALRQWYCKGYFEIRCICNKDEGFWSAFWMQSNHSYDAQSKGGVGGAEIDIFEAGNYNAKLPNRRNSVTQTVYCNGSDNDDENIDKCQFRAVGKDIFNTYNTYGVKWTDDEYIFYINGVETVRTSFGLGVSEVLENLIVSLELPDELPSEISSNPNYKTQMIVDWVKIYQPV